ncbi:MAG: hypothetical protein IK103_05620 [Bacteroidales bacterium]|nr:hypothetical protein [Bacteroidales bacterium]
MMRTGRYVLAMCLVMLCSSAFSQRRDARDKALDRYDVVCNRLIELRDALRRGETISAQELSALRAEVSSIRSNLQRSPEGLTPEQTIRFNRIRRRYNYGYELKELSMIKAIPVTYRAKDIRMSGRYPYMEQPYYDIGKTGFLALAQVSPVPDMAFGLCLGMLRSGKGAYVSVVSNFKSRSASIDCLSDGTSSGNPVWVSGRQDKTRLAITAGGIFRVADNVNLLAGAGYGTRKLLWENTGGDWMRVTDRSYSGIAAEAGALFTLGRRESFCLSAKAGTIAFKYLDFTVGIGYRF